MSRSYSIRFAIALGIASLVAVTSCKKADPSPSAEAPAPTPPAPPAPEAPRPAEPKPGPVAAPPATPPPEVAPKPAEPKPEAAPEPADAPKPVDAPPAAGELSDVAPTRQARTRQAICTRSCNKSQICGVSEGSVADCFETCTKLLDAESTPEGRAAAAGVHAKDSCADGPCTGFVACAEAAAPREYAYLAAPPVSPKAARAACGPICELEKKCQAAPDPAAPADACASTCEAVLTSIDLRVAAERYRLQTLEACKDVPCDGRTACLESKTKAPAPP